MLVGSSQPFQSSTLYRVERVHNDTQETPASCELGLICLRVRETPHFMQVDKGEGIGDGQQWLIWKAPPVGAEGCVVEVDWPFTLTSFLDRAVFLT